MLLNYIMWIWYDFGMGREYESFNIFIVFCFILVYFNFVINFFIFVFFYWCYCKGMFNFCNVFKVFVFFCLKLEICDDVVIDNNCNRNNYGIMWRKRKMKKKNCKLYMM